MSEFGAWSTAPNLTRNVLNAIDVAFSFQESSVTELYSFELLMNIIGFLLYFFERHVIHFLCIPTVHLVMFLSTVDETRTLKCCITLIFFSIQQKSYLSKTHYDNEQLCTNTPTERIPAESQAPPAHEYVCACQKRTVLKLSSVVLYMFMVYV